MCLPDQIQCLTSLAPYAHFPAPAPGCPVLPVATNGDSPGGIKGLGKDAVTQRSPGERGILHLDPLHIRPTKGEISQMDATQVPTQLSQQRQQTPRSIALSVLHPFA